MNSKKYSFFTERKTLNWKSLLIERNKQNIEQTSSNNIASKDLVDLISRRPSLLNNNLQAQTIKGKLYLINEKKDSLHNIIDFTNISGITKEIRHRAITEPIIKRNIMAIRNTQIPKFQSKSNLTLMMKSRSKSNFKKNDFIMKECENVLENSKQTEIEYRKKIEKTFKEINFMDSYRQKFNQFLSENPDSIPVLIQTAIEQEQIRKREEKDLTKDYQETKIFKTLQDALNSKRKKEIILQSLRKTRIFRRDMLI